MIEWFEGRTGYLLLRPWKIVAEGRRRVKWAWQRVFRGWDDRVVWSIDSYLSEKMPEWIAVLRDKKQGIPMLCIPEGATGNSGDGLEEGEAKWDGILDDMIDGFNAAREIQNSYWPGTYDETVARFRRGMALFVEHYFDLWD